MVVTSFVSQETKGILVVVVRMVVVIKGTGGTGVVVDVDESSGTEGTVDVETGTLLAVNLFIISIHSFSCCFSRSNFSLQYLILLNELSVVVVAGVDVLNFGSFLKRSKPADK